MMSTDSSLYLTSASLSASQPLIRGGSIEHEHRMRELDDSLKEIRVQLDELRTQKSISLTSSLDTSETLETLEKRLQERGVSILKMECRLENFEFLHILDKIREGLVPTIKLVLNEDTVPGALESYRETRQLQRDLGNLRFLRMLNAIRAGILPDFPTETPSLEMTTEKFNWYASHLLLQTHLEFNKKLESFPEKKEFFFNLEEKLLKLENFLMPYLDKCLKATQTQLRENKPLEETRLPKNSEIKILEKMCTELDSFLKEFSGHPGCYREETYEYYRWIQNGLKEDISKGILLEFVKMQIKMREINHMIYLNQVQNIINRNKHAILTTLFPSLAQSHSIDSFTIVPNKSETHNRGQVACRVFFNQQETACTFYYKPRSASMDIEILNLFRILNDLTDNKSTENQLSTYTIMNLPNNEGSVWEFIEGTHPIHPQFNAPTDLQTVTEAEPNLTRKAFMQAQLARLETICKTAGITDLHGGNLLLDHRGKVTLIDLECLSEPNSDTMLSGKKLPLQPIAVTEQVAIQSFLKSATKIPNRVVPIETMTWGTRMRDLGSIKYMLLNTDKDFHRLIKKNYTLLNENLCINILKNYVDCDFPYFTEYRDNVYLGSVKPENLIAKRSDYATPKL